MENLSLVDGNVLNTTVPAESILKRGNKNPERLSDLSRVPEKVKERQIVVLPLLRQYLVTKHLQGSQPSLGVICLHVRDNYRPGHQKENLVVILNLINSRQLA